MKEEKKEKKEKKEKEKKEKKEKKGVCVKVGLGMVFGKRCWWFG